MPGVAAQACAFAAFSGVLFGLDQGNYNGASQFDSFFQTFCVGGGYGTLAQCKAPSTEKPAGWVNIEMFFAPVLQVGSAVSSLMLAPLISQRLGRRSCIFWGACISFWGMVFISISTTIGGFIVARIITGIGVGAVTYATPQYTSELAPKETRGKLTSLFQLSTVGGVVLAQAITLKHEGMDWSVPFIIPCLPAALIAAGIFYFPESPRWVMTSGLDSPAEKETVRTEVRDILRRLRGDGADADAAVEEEYNEIVASCEQQRANDAATGGSSSNGYQFLRNPDLRFRSFVACFMQLAQQLTGINGFTTLGAQFFLNAGVKDIYMSNFLPSLTSFAGTCVQLYIIDSMGRRPLLLSGMGLMGFSVIVSAILLTPGIKGVSGGEGAGAGVESVGVVDAEMANSLLVCMVCLFTFAFGFSWGPIPWLFGSEIFPFNVKVLQ
jgi:MFS family permease